MLLIFVAKVRIDKIIYHQLHKLKGASLLVFAMCSSCFVVFNGHFLILLFVMLFMIFASGGAHHGSFFFLSERVVVFNLFFLI